MNSVTKLTILVVILAILIGALLLIQRHNKGIETGPGKQASAPFFPDLSADKVYRISIAMLDTQGKQSLLLRKNAGVWEVANGINALAQMMRKNNEGQQSTAGQESALTPEGTISTGQAESATQNEPANPLEDVGAAGDPSRIFYKADADKVKAMIDAFVTMKHGELVTSDPNKKTQFKVVAPVLGTEVTFYDDQMNKLADLVVGDMGPDYRSTFVVRQGSNDIYQVPTNIKMMFETNLMSVRSKSIFDAAPETIMSVNLKDYGLKTQISLNRTEGVWQGSDAQGTALQLSTAQVDNFLSAIGTLAANSFVDKNAPPSRPQTPPVPTNPEDPYGFAAPTLEIQFTTSDNVTHSIIVGKAEGTTSYAYADGRTDDLFKLSNTMIATIRPTVEQLAGHVNAQPVGAGAKPVQAPSSPAHAVPAPPPSPPPPPPGGGG
jgi:hypothetical protein